MKTNTSTIKSKSFWLLIIVLLLMGLSISSCGSGDSGGGSSTSTPTPSAESTPSATVNVAGEIVQSKLPTLIFSFSEEVSGVEANLALYEGDKDGREISLKLIKRENNSYSFIPNENLKPETKYTLVTKDGIMNKKQTRMPSKSFSFMTGNIIRPNAVITNDVSSLPAKPSLNIIFTNAMKNVDTSTVKLFANSPSSGSEVAISINSDTNKKVFTITPNSNLTLGGTYFLVLSPNLIDTQDNKIDGGLLWELHVLNGPSATLLTDTTKLPVKPTVIINFTNSMANVSNNTIKLLANDRVSGQEVPISIKAKGKDLYEITPDSDLTLGGVYYLVLSSSLVDINGNNIDGTLDWELNIVSKLSVSLVSSPSNVGLSADLKVQFNDFVNGVNKQTVTITERTATGTPITISNINDEDSNQYTITASGLKPATQYFLNFNDKIKSQGDHLVPVSINFTTEVPQGDYKTVCTNFKQVDNLFSATCTANNKTATSSIDFSAFCAESELISIPSTESGAVLACKSYSNNMAGIPGYYRGLGLQYFVANTNSIILPTKLEGGILTYRTYWEYNGKKNIDAESQLDINSCPNSEFITGLTSDISYTTGETINIRPDITCSITTDGAARYFQRGFSLQEGDKIIIDQKAMLTMTKIKGELHLVSYKYNSLTKQYDNLLWDASTQAVTTSGYHLYAFQFDGNAVAYAYLQPYLPFGRTTVGSSAVLASWTGVGLDRNASFVYGPDGQLIIYTAKGAAYCSSSAANCFRTS